MDTTHTQNRTRFPRSLVQSAKGSRFNRNYPIWVVFFSALLTTSGCLGPVKQPRPFSGELPAIVVADWDDIPAAFSRSRLRTQSIRVTHTEVGTGEAGSVARYEVISIHDDRVIVELTTLEDWPDESGGPVPIEIRVTSPLLDSESYDRALVGELVHHLKALAGRATAPASG